MKVKIILEVLGLYIGLVFFSMFAILMGIFSGNKGLIAAVLLVTANLLTPMIVAFKKPVLCFTLAGFYILVGTFILTYLNYIDLSIYWQKRLIAVEIFFVLNFLYILGIAYLYRKPWFSARLTIALAYIPLILGFALFPNGAATFP